MSTGIPEPGEIPDGPAGPIQPASGSAGVNDTSEPESGCDARRAGSARGTSEADSGGDAGSAHDDVAESGTTKRDGGAGGAIAVVPLGERSPEDLAAIEELKQAWVGRCQATGCDVGPEDDEERLETVRKVIADNRRILTVEGPGFP